LFPSCWIPHASGSPENRTQRHVVISRVWATSPRLPFHRSVAPTTASRRCPESNPPLRLERARSSDR